MFELRLLDPNGYEAATEGHRLQGVAPDRVSEQVAHLKNEVARRHAAEHSYADYQPAEYDVRITEESTQC